MRAWRLRDAMRYDFYCQACRKGYEVTTTASKRDEPHKCPQGHVMRRQLSVPMATLWAGKFHSPWNKKETGEW